MKKYIMAVFIWIMIITIAILNGGFREYVLVDLLKSYNILTGNTWLLVVLTALFAPMAVMRIRK